MQVIELIQLGTLIVGVISILVAGLQDKKNRLAPAIYLSPALIGFAINPLLGLIGVIGTTAALFLWKDEWNKKVGLADVLLFFTLFLSLANMITLTITLLTSACVYLDLMYLQKKNEPQPIVWIFAKWLGLILTLGLALSIHGWFFG